MKNFLFSLVAALIFSFGYGQHLTDSSKFSIITCGPDPGPVYLAFGHSAIRMVDRSLGVDYVFNYGVFDFAQPNFYLDFARGSNNYLLGAYDYQYFEQSYIEDNRFLHEQSLNLTLDQRQRLYKFLVWNSMPANRAYWYDPYYDNCATRVRDAFVKVFGDSVKFDGSYISTKYTIRQLKDLYAKSYPWGNLGIDICQGMPIDRVATPYQYMYLPAYIESGFDHATIMNDSATVPLVGKKRVVYEAKPFPASWIPHPIYVMGLIALIALVLAGRDFSKQQLSTWFDALLFGVTGFIGIILLLLWFFTDHKAAADNLNLIWALPTHLIAVFAMIAQPRWLKWYFLLTALIQLALIIGWFFLPQQLNTALIPLATALMVRSYIQFVLRKRGAYTRARIAKEMML
ncbi:DUF4105 domain-containing protein [Chryseolinea sp. T2]|uniref:lipoprotein N-acyltransferase Lnb domain-containing protein n=1 Tax=Chryseolinea sp. T2 TaxID=3129255 RepID=UPI00307828E3